MVVAEKCAVAHLAVPDKFAVAYSVAADMPTDMV